MRDSSPGVQTQQLISDVQRLALAFMPVVPVSSLYEFIKIDEMPVYDACKALSLLSEMLMIELKTIHAGRLRQVWLLCKEAL